MVTTPLPGRAPVSNATPAGPNAEPPPPPPPLLVSSLVARCRRRRRRRRRGRRPRRRRRPRSPPGCRRHPGRPAPQCRRSPGWSRRSACRPRRRRSGCHRRRRAFRCRCPHRPRPRCHLRRRRRHPDYTIVGVEVAATATGPAGDDSPVGEVGPALANVGCPAAPAAGVDLAGAAAIAAAVETTRPRDAPVTEHDHARPGATDRRQLLGGRALLFRVKGLGHRPGCVTAGAAHVDLERLTRRHRERRGRPAAETAAAAAVGARAALGAERVDRHLRTRLPAPRSSGLRR